MVSKYCSRKILTTAPATLPIPGRMQLFSEPPCHFAGPSEINPVRDDTARVFSSQTRGALLSLTNKKGRIGPVLMFTSLYTISVRDKKRLI